MRSFLIEYILDYLWVWLSGVCILINVIEVKMPYSKIQISIFFFKKQFSEATSAHRKESQG